MHMGVNRRSLSSCSASCRCPHAHGGEPQIAGKTSGTRTVVPMHMGVNRDGTSIPVAV